MIRRVSLAGQLLILQLGIVLVVLVAVSAVSINQAQASFREVQGRRGPVGWPSGRRPPRSSGGPVRS